MLACNCTAHQIQLFKQCLLRWIFVLTRGSSIHIQQEYLANGRPRHQKRDWEEQILKTTLAGRNKVGREKIQGDRLQCDTVNHRPQERKEHVKIIWGTPSVPTQRRYQPMEKANQAPVSPYPRTESGDGILFFPPLFFRLACGEGGGGYIDPIYHGGSHYHSDHFALTHCKLRAGQWPFHSVVVTASAEHTDMENVTTKRCLLKFHCHMLTLQSKINTKCKTDFSGALLHY